MSEENKVIEVSKNFENLLKNAGTIHRNIMIKEGSDILRVTSSDNTLMMTAKMDCKLPNYFVIYDIMEFLSVLSLVNEAYLDMNEDSYVVIKDSKNEMAIKYQYADERMISGYMDKDLVPDEVLIEFDLNADKMKAAYRAANTLKLPNLAFVGDGENIEFIALDSKLEEGSLSNSFSSKLGTTDKTFNCVFDSEYFKMIEGDYQVQIGKRKEVLVALFANKSIPVVYVLALNTNSTFE